MNRLCNCETSRFNLGETLSYNISNKNLVAKSAISSSFAYKIISHK